MASLKQIFISHSSKDDRIASKICNILEKNGLTCCMDHRDFRPGKDFDQEILDFMDGSSAFVLLLSSNSNDSVQIKRELQQAADCGKKNWIFPVRIENVEPSRELRYFLSLKQWTDAFEEPLEPQLSYLVENLREFLKIEKPFKDLFYTHYQKALQYRKDDPEVAFQYIEKATEEVCRKIYSDLGLPPGKGSISAMKLEEIIKSLGDSKRISGHILIPLGIIQSFTNYINKEADKETKYLTDDYLAPSMDALTTVINWYYKDFSTNTGISHDVVLCFSPDDYMWVEKNIYQILVRSRKPDGSRTKTLQVCNNNPGISEVQLLAETISAIKNSGKAVFLFSNSFFSKNFEKSVLAQTIQLDPEGKNRLILALLYPGFGEKEIPIAYLNITPVAYNSINWVVNLTKILGLIPLESSPQTRLEFENKVDDSYINQPLRGIRVLLSNRNEESFSECEVEILSDKKDLIGTLKQKTAGGIAEFNDLSFLTGGKKITLRAVSEGYPEAISNDFNIKEFDVKEKVGETARSEIILSGTFQELLISKNGKQAVALHPDSFSLINIQARSARSFRTSERLKVADSFEDIFVLADWSGNTYLIKEGLEIAKLPPPENEFVYNIPAKSAVCNNEVFIAFWNGYVCKFDGKGEIETVLKHSTEIQHFSALGDSFHICSPDGILFSYQGSSLKHENPVEKRILGMHSGSKSVIIIGENNIYHYSPAKNLIISEKSGLHTHESVFFAKEFFAVVDTNGKVAILDYEFVKLSTFTSTRGSRIIFIDDNKEFCILEYLNNTCVLIKSGRVIFSNTSGPVMLDPNREILLIGTGNRLSIHDKSYINKISQT